MPPLLLNGIVAKVLMKQLMPLALLESIDSNPKPLLLGLTRIVNLVVLSIKGRTIRSLEMVMVTTKTKHRTKAIEEISPQKEKAKGKARVKARSSLIRQSSRIMQLTLLVPLLTVSYIQLRFKSTWPLFPNPPSVTNELVPKTEIALEKRNYGNTLIRT